MTRCFLDDTIDLSWKHCRFAGRAEQAVTRCFLDETIDLSWKHCRFAGRPQDAFWEPFASLDEAEQAVTRRFLRLGLSMWVW